MTTTNGNLDFYKEVYYKELERRNHLNTEISLQTTLLVAIVSGLFYLLNSFKTEHLSLFCFFIALFLVNLGHALCAGYYLLRSYYDFLHEGRAYKYLPKMALVDRYFHEVEDQEYRSTFSHPLQKLVTPT